MNYLTFISLCILCIANIHSSAQEPQAKRQKTIKQGCLTPLQNACLQNNPTTVKALTRCKEIVIDGSQNPTPLYIACDPQNQHYEDQYAIITYLLAAKASITTIHTNSHNDAVVSTPYTQILQNTYPKTIKLVFNLYPSLADTTRNNIKNNAQKMSYEAFQILVNINLENLNAFDTIASFANTAFLKELYVAGSQIFTQNENAHTYANFKNDITLNTRKTLKTALHLRELYTEKNGCNLDLNVQADIFSARMMILKKTVAQIKAERMLLITAQPNSRTHGCYRVLPHIPAENSYFSPKEIIQNRIQKLIYKERFCHEYFFALFTVFKTTQTHFTFFKTNFSEEEYASLYKKFTEFMLQTKLQQQLKTLQQYCTVTIECIQ